ADSVARLCAAGAADLCRVRPCLDQLSLEQFSLAADRDQFGGKPAADRRTGGVRRARDRRRLVDHYRGHGDDHGAAADRFPAVPAPVRAVLYARGDPLMLLITWNIQWGKGCDGVVDLKRIVSVARSLADADVFCFQEVSEGFASLDGDAEQAAQLAALLPDHRPVFRPAIETIDSEGRPHRFGNMTLSRLPVLQVASHLLPWPQ